MYGALGMLCLISQPRDGLTAVLYIAVYGDDFLCMVLGPYIHIVNGMALKVFT